MITYIIAGLLLLVGIALIFAFYQPTEYLISREVIIDKTAESIYPYINNSKMMNTWAPWPEIDPQLEMKYSGPEFGVGATSSWDSPGKMGAGSAIVIESLTNQMVRTQLEYTRPFPMKQIAEISISPMGTQSKVKWSVRGQNLFVQRVVCLVMNMDKMVGGSFEVGLSKLKSIVESL